MKFVLVFFIGVLVAVSLTCSIPATPIPTPQPTPDLVATIEVLLRPTATPVPTVTPIPTPTPTPTPTPVPTPTPILTATPTSTDIAEAAETIRAIFHCVLSDIPDQDQLASELFADDPEWLEMSALYGGALLEGLDILSDQLVVDLFMAGVDEGFIEDGIDPTTISLQDKMALTKIGFAVLGCP